jgi:hypothetical protein
MRARNLIAWSVALSLTSGLAAAAGLFNLALGVCDEGGSDFKDVHSLCDSEYGLLAVAPPALICVGAAFAWRKRDYGWLVVAALLAATVVAVSFSLPDIFLERA